MRINPRVALGLVLVAVLAGALWFASAEVRLETPRVEALPREEQPTVPVVDERPAPFPAVQAMDAGAVEPAPAVTPPPVAPRGPEEGPRGTLGISWSFTGRGPEVEQLTHGSPAAAAGVKVQDVVVEVDGAAVQSIQQATERMLKGSGQAARLKVQRGKEFLLLDVSRKWDE